MMRYNMKLVFVMLLIIAQITTLTSAFNTQLVKANPRIWIVDDDGPADFHTIQEAISAAEAGDTIFVKNGTYYENVVVNKTLTLLGENNVATIVDANQTEFVISTACSNVTVEGFTLRNTNRDSSTQGFGIIAYNASNCFIHRNILCLNFYGIKLTLCANSTITNNEVTDNIIGVICESDPNCTFRDNRVHNNLYNGILIKSSDNCTLHSNYVARSNYGIRIEHSNDCTIKNNTVEKTIDCGIQTYYSNNSNVYDNTVNGNFQLGISVKNSMDSTIAKNVLKNNSNWYGFEIYYSNNSRVVDNILDNNCHGMQLEQSNDCEIYGNEIYGSKIYSFSNGIFVDLSNNNKVSYNKIENNSYGLLLFCSNKCTINANTVKGNRAYGIWMYNSSENTLFHNNFINNTAQTFIANSANMWNKTIEGNYWSNYRGTDQNFDGIGDEVFTIKENNVDYHPLLGIFSNFKTSLGPSIYTICNSTISHFTYEPNNSTIRFIVNGTEGTDGFCRICILHLLMNGTYNVTIDGVKPYLVNYTLHDDGEKRWIYFAYLHSPHEVVIVLEFPSFPILSLFMIATPLAVVFYRRKHST